MAGGEKSFNDRLLMIVALAFGLRFVGIWFGLPAIYHQDEPVIVNHALAIGGRSWNPHFFVIPPFTIYVLFILYGVTYAAGLAAGIFHTPTDFALSFLTDPSACYLIGRIFLGALLGIATVAVLGRLGKTAFGPRAGLWAAFFLATCFLHAVHSHYLYADIPLTFFLCLFLYSVLRTFERQTIGNFLVAGLWLGLATSAKYTALYFLPSAIVAHFLILGSSAFKPKGLLPLAAAAIACAGAYLAVAPYTLLDWPEFIRQIHRQSGAEGSVGLGYHFRYSLLNGLGMPLIILAVYGLWAGLRSRARKTIFLASAVLIYYGVSAYFSQPFARYMMPALLILCLFAAAGLTGLADRFKAKPKLTVFIGGGIVLSQLLPVIYTDALFVRQDTRDLCARWIRRTIPEESTVVLDNRFYGPRLDQTLEQIKEKYVYPEARDPAKRKRLDLMCRVVARRKTYRIYGIRWSEGDEGPGFLFQRPRIKLGSAEWDQVNPKYLVVNYSEYRPELLAYLRTHSDRYVLRASFSPFWQAGLKQPLDPYSCTAAPDSPEDLFSRKRLGPYLEVYEAVSPSGTG